MENTEQISISSTKYIIDTHLQRGSSSSVGIATDYGLDGPGSNPDEDEIFH